MVPNVSKLLRPLAYLIKIILGLRYRKACTNYKCCLGFRGRFCGIEIWN